MWFYPDSADKEVAHLTYVRLALKPEAKPWPVIRIAGEINGVLDVFLANVPKEKLCTQWDGFKW
jgi:hypothetical protein